MTKYEAKLVETRTNSDKNIFTTISFISTILMTDCAKELHRVSVTIFLIFNFVKDSESEVLDIETRKRLKWILIYFFNYKLLKKIID